MALLSLEPLIVASVIGVKRMPLFSTMPRAVARRPAHLLLGLGWSADDDTLAEQFAEVCRRHRAAHPRHHIVVLANEPGAVPRLRVRGVEAVPINQNAFVDDRIFKPLPGRQPRYDAVYNARFTPFKRHDLAREVERLVLIGYPAQGEARPSDGYLPHLRAVLPHASYANEWRDGRPSWLRPEQVNEVLNDARVGLCLSAVEGAMYASAEYLLSGLPIVTTPSRGGRDYFFDPEFCLTVEPDPRQIREAVQALVARNIPRQHVRARTLERIEAVRRRFFELVQQIYDAHGVARRFADEWPILRRHRLIEWVPIRRFWRDVAQRRAGRWRSPREAAACPTPPARGHARS